MKAANYLVLWVLVFALSGCPFGQVPEGVPPLPTPKTGKTSFKTKVCRPLRAYSNDGRYWFSYQYDAEGRITSVRDNFGQTYNYVYRPDGYLDAVLFNGGDVSFFYAYGNDGNHYIRSKVVRRKNLLDDFFDYREKGILKGCYFANDPFNSWCVVDETGTILGYKFLTSQYITSYTYDNLPRPLGRSRDNVTRTVLSVGSSVAARFDYEFDKHPSPLSLIAIKDVPAPTDLFSRIPDHANRNNYTTETFTNYDKGANASPSYVARYTYTYNELGLPVTVTKQYDNGRVEKWTNVYEGCTK